MAHDVRADRPLVVRFDWRAVDGELIRSMLDAVYRAADHDVISLQLSERRLEDLPGIAERVLGSPPAMKHMGALVDVLRDGWLDQLPGDRLDELVNMIQHDLTGPARDERLTSKRARIEFIRRRRRTHNLKIHLRRAFLAAHQARLPARQKSAPRGSSDPAPRTLAGAGQPDLRRPYPHQEQAWASLDRMAAASHRDERGGLLVLPTGAGKTYTMVRWLIDWLAVQPRAAVLWIADRQELVEQAAATFQDVAAAQPEGFVRMLRRIHDGASPATTLADGALHVAVTTRQSLRGRGFDAGSRKRLRAFLRGRPSVVVVDEAHHAVAPTYEDLLDFVQDEFDPLLVGLTATPWPTADGAAARLRARFPQTVATAEVGELIEAGVLARPVHHTVDTAEQVDLTDEERRILGVADIPQDLLRRLDTERRNDVIVDAWWQRRTEWGKTLVFAVDIAHADRLHALFCARGADALVVHSRADSARVEVLERFRRLDGPCVLISVGMLTEGVDLPDARTAVLARPTTSRILLRQMIGRVLRGPLGGGEPEAHIIDVRDRWDDDVDVLRPIELPIGGRTEQRPGPGEHLHVLPPIVDELTGDPVPEDVVARVLRAFGERVRGMTGLPTFSTTTLVGFYRLDDLSVPVFTHTRERYGQLIDAALRDQPARRIKGLERFGDLPVPRPLRRDVEAVVDFTHAHRVAPPFEPLRVVLDMRAVARELWGKDLSVAAQYGWLRHRYESGLARAAFPTFQGFYEAVHQELFALGPDGGSGLDPENPRLASPPTMPAARLRRSTDRDLEPLLAHVRALGDEILAADDPHYRELLATALDVGWTESAVPGVLAYWAPRIAGRSRGEPVIRVNRLLCAPRSQIPDEVLVYLLWHEVIHHLLPGQGHDAEFRRLEALWPESEVQDQFLDTLDERFDLRHWIDEQPEA